MKIVFGATVAIILLGIYVYLVGYGVSISICINSNECSVLTKEDFTEKMVSSLALISGLISALVIAELSVTKPGEVPTTRLINANLSTGIQNLTKIITSFYLLVWLIVGLAAFVFGYLTATESISVIADLGLAWLGIAVGAGYSYFGIKP